MVVHINMSSGSLHRLLSGHFAKFRVTSHRARRAYEHPASSSAELRETIAYVIDRKYVGVYQHADTSSTESHEISLKPIHGRPKHGLGAPLGV